MVSISSNYGKLYEVQSVLEEQGVLDVCTSILCRVAEHIDRAVIIHTTDSAVEFERQIRLYAHWDYTVIKGDLHFTRQPSSYEDRTVPVFNFNREIPQILMAVTRGLDKLDRWFVLIYDPSFHLTFD